MQKLPIGIQSFEKIRLGNYLYVDKTKQILQMIEKGECYFFSRPRRFGKSLTLSTLEAMFKGKAELFKGLYAEDWVKEQSKHPSPVIKLDMLIDEYDKPITDNINNLEKAEEMREILRSFYSVLKGCSQLKFIMITGVSKFSKIGVFSCLNNLKDISMLEEYSDIVGYTQQELEKYFVDYFEKPMKKFSFSKEELLEKIKDYYDGFSFDGIVYIIHFQY